MPSTFLSLLFNHDFLIQTIPPPLKKTASPINPAAPIASSISHLAPSLLQSPSLPFTPPNPRSNLFSQLSSPSPFGSPSIKIHCPRFLYTLTSFFMIIYDFSPHFLKFNPSQQTPKNASKRPSHTPNPPPPYLRPSFALAPL